MSLEKVNRQGSRHIIYIYTVLVATFAVPTALLLVEVLEPALAGTLPLLRRHPDLAEALADEGL